MIDLVRVFNAVDGGPVYHTRSIKATLHRASIIGYSGDWVVFTLTERGWLAVHRCQSEFLARWWIASGSGGFDLCIIKI